MTLVLVFGLGCQVGPRGVRYEGGDGTSLATPVIIEGARGNKAVLTAEQAWIRHRFPGALLQKRELAVDPLTSLPLDLSGSPDENLKETAPDTTSIRFDPELWYEWVEFRTRNGEIKVTYFALGFAALDSDKKAFEDLAGPYRCVNLIQEGRIQRGMTVDDLRRVMTSTRWIEGEGFHIEENDARAHLSEWKSDRISLTPFGSPPVWRITFKIEGNTITDYQISKPRSK